MQIRIGGKNVLRAALTRALHFTMTFLLAALGARKIRSLLSANFETHAPEPYPPAEGDCFARFLRTRLPRAMMGRACSVSRRKPRTESLALKPGAHEGHVDWERPEAIRRIGLAPPIQGPCLAHQGWRFAPPFRRLRP
jgi:hypothetical protein